MNFTQEQKKIFEFVKSGSGHGIIDAVAGSGKTTTIMKCTKYVENQERTLFCAFNNSIADEIKKRLCKDGSGDVTVKTIHALGYQLLKNQSSRNLKVKAHKYSQLLRSKAMRENLAEYYQQIFELMLENQWVYPWTKTDIAERRGVVFKDIQFRIDDTLLNLVDKNRLTLPRTDDEFEEMVEQYRILTAVQREAGLLKLYRKMHDILLEEGNALAREASSIDYADMLYLPYKWELSSLMTYDFIFIDECQDLSRAQLYTVMKYASQKCRVMSVGDPFQAIYGFAGADAESFNRISQTFQATPFPLTTCFRCPEKVIELAKGIRADITGKKDNVDGKIHSISNSEIEKKVAAGDLIISRKRDMLMVLAFNLLDKGKSISIHQDDANSVISKLKSIFKPEERLQELNTSIQGNETFWNYVLKRNNFRIEKEVGKEKSLNNVMKQMKIKEQKKAIEVSINFLKKLVSNWKHLSTIEEILKELHDQITSHSSQAIKLSTIHRAKGLENDRVFILAYDELPLIHDAMQNWEIEQEKNLKYVALTRPKKELFLVNNDIENIVKNRGSLFDNLPHL